MVVRASLALAVLLAAGLAGCSGDGSGVDEVVEPTYVTPPPLTVTEGTFQYHESVGFQGVYNPATQVAVSPCSYGSGTYFNNRPLPVAGGFEQRPRNGNLTVTMSWEVTDFPGAFLVLGYAAPGMRNITDSPHILNGQPITLPIQVPFHASPDGWRMNACINRSDEQYTSVGWQPGPFLGSFTIKAVFQGDPEIPLELLPQDDRRTSKPRPGTGG